jgi:hypothetical protein
MEPPVETSVMYWGCGLTLKYIQPRRLLVVLGCQSHGVEKHEDDDGPVKSLGLANLTADPTRTAIEAIKCIPVGDIISC